MNVLQILPELNAGGVERTSVEVAEALLADGHTAHIASKGGRLEKELRDLGAVLHILPIGSKNPLKLRRNTKALIDIIKAHKIDIVHVRSRAPAWPAYTAAKAQNIPFITTYHGIYNANSALKRRYNSIMARGDIVIANSEFTKAHIMKEHGTPSETIIVIPRGVDMKAFNPAIVDPVRISALRDAWQVNSAHKVILLPGRLTRWKGQLIAVEALLGLPENTVLILLGDAQGREAYRAEILELARKLDVNDRVRIVGHCTDMPAALLAADVVLSASTDPEAFGRISAEAQAMGRPVIATRHGGALETVLHGVTGLHIQPRDATSMREGLKKALNWPDYDGKIARWRIEERFSKAKLQSDILDIYNRVFDLNT